MTLKQFFQIAGGALVSILIYSTGLPTLIKWPLMLFFALLGVALAFLPLQERPLERWIVAFFRSVYSPTHFFWKKTEFPINYFQEEAAIPAEKITNPEKEAKLREYLNVVPSDQSSGKLEKTEKTFLSSVFSLFGGLQEKKIELPVVLPQMVVEEIPATPTAPLSPPVYQTITENPAQFSVDAAPPNPPSAPNTLTGQVIDQERKIVEGAILEVKDAVGRPVRALKSNKLGHFMVVTPLQSGKYEIITEKDGYEFSPIAFEATGAIIPPIAISGKSIGGVSL